MDETNSLKLEDMDDVVLLEAIEAAFDIQFVESEVGELQTVGDLYDLLQAKLGTTPQGRQRRITAVCFYRLKQATAEISGRRITAQTAIADVFSAKELVPRMRMLGQKTGFRLPSVPISLEQFLLFLLAVLSCCAALFFGLMTIPGITCVLIAIGFFCVIRLTDFPRKMADPSTFGDLARQTAFLNYGRLAQETGTRNSLDLWEALDFMIRSSVAFEGRIERDTWLT